MSLTLPARAKRASLLESRVEESDGKGSGGRKGPNEAAGEIGVMRRDCL